MRITVGIPIHNEIETLRLCLQALEDALSFAGLEAHIVVVSDYSSVETDFALCAIAKRTPGLTVLYTASRTEQTNPNLGLAVNMALEQVGVDDLFYLNLESDVLLRQDTILRLVEAIDKADAAAVIPVMLRHDGKFDLNFWNLGYVDALPEHLCRQRACTWTNMGCLLMRAGLATKIRIDERFRLWCADGDFTCQIRSVAGPVLFCPDIEAAHLGSVTTKQGSGLYDGMIKSAVHLFDAKWKDQLNEGNIWL